MKNSRSQLGALFFLALLISSIQAVVAQGTSFTYQGRLDDNGAPANGSYDFRFRLSVDSLGNVFIGAPVLANAVPVTSGLFTTALDFGAVFTGSNYWVQVDVKTNGAGGYTTLIPLQKVMPAPYTIMANAASNLLGTLPTAQLSGTIGTAQIADGTIASADLGPNSVNTTHIIDGQVANADLANNAVNSAKVLDASLLGADLANNTVTSLQLADNISLGDGVLDGQLHIYNTAAGGAAISLFGNGTGGYQYLYQDDGQVGIYLDGDSGGGGLQYLYAADGSAGVTLDGESGGAGLISIQNTNGSSRILLDGAGSGSGGQVSVYAQDASTTIQLLGESTGAGLINVNNNLSQTRVAIDGEGNAAGGQITLFSADGGNGINLYADSGGAGLAYIYSADGSVGVTLDGDSGGAGLVSVLNTNGSTRVSLDGSGTGFGGQITVSAADSSTTIQLYGDSGAAGLINVNNSVSQTRVAIDGEGNGAGGQINLYSGDGGSGVILYGDVGGAGYVGILNTNGSSRVVLDGYNSYAGGQVNVYSSAGSARVILYGQDSAGDGRVVCDVLQINGGADLSEQFDVKAMNESIAPGAIVCIDPANPGKLVVSSKAYDRTVAGVLSGAGGVKPGMLMGQTGTLADGKHPVALTGRVYCLADAEEGAIQPGDLITTSSTPGHGMKASDHSRAQGAIIGKAMTSLADGKGLVLVLVSLQ